MDEWMDLMDRWVDGWIRWMDGWTDGFDGSISRDRSVLLDISVSHFYLQDRMKRKVLFDFPILECKINLFLILY